MLGVGAVIGSFVGGFIAGRARHLEWLAAISLTSGAVTGLFFVLDAHAWIVVAVAFAASVLVSVSVPVFTTLNMNLAGQSRGTAGGMFATTISSVAFWAPRPEGLCCLWAVTRRWDCCV